MLPKHEQLGREHLQKIPLFSELDLRELTMILKAARSVEFAKGSMVFQEGDGGDDLFVIMSGRVKVVLEGEQGQEVTLAILEEGNFFGEMALLESVPRSATVITLEPCQFLQLDQNSFFVLLQNHPSMGVKILKNLSSRLRAASEKIRSLVMVDVYGRVARCLADMAKSQGPGKPKIIANRPSHQELAHMIGCSRETVSRAMKVLQDEGFLTMTRKEMIVYPDWKGRL